MSNENSKLNDLTKLLSDKDVVGGLSENPNNAPEILKKANLTNEEAQDVGNLVASLKELSPEELKLASGGNVKDSLLKGYHATTAFGKAHWKPIATAAALVVTAIGVAVDRKHQNYLGQGIKAVGNLFSHNKNSTGPSSLNSDPPKTEGQPADATPPNDKT